MKKKEWIRTIKFGLFSISAGAIETITYAIFNDVCLFAPWLSHLLSLTLSVLWNFTFNRKFTFKSASNVPVAMLLVGAYYLVFTPLSTLWTNALTGVGWNEYLVLALTMIVNFVTEFLYQRFVVFRKSIDTNAKRVEEESGEDCVQKELQEKEEQSCQSEGESDGDDKNVV